jgi:uncharacterized protein (DUF2236 family)
MTSGTAHEAFHSTSWKINAERTVLLGWGAAMVMQFSHPLVAQGVAEHSVAVARPRERFRRLQHTIDAMLSLTFGTPQEAVLAARGIMRIHDRVHGQLPHAVGPHPSGASYSAHDPALLLWVHATLLYALPRAYELLIGPLSAEERERFCAESTGMNVVFGIPASDMPRSMAEIQAYLNQMMDSETLAAGETSRELVRMLLAPPLGALIYLPTVGLLPPAIRELYGLRWSRYHEAALRGLGWLSRRIVPMLPAAWRYWPAARLAMAAPTPDRLHTPAQPKFTANELR